MKPTTSLIEDSIYTQYVELQRKKITGWNQRTKHKMDVHASLKKERTNVQKEIMSDTAKIDWMIQWMEESGLVNQELLSEASKGSYEAVFLPLYSMPKGPIICSPIQHTHLSGYGSSQRYISGKGKTPMERGQLSHFDDSNTD
ncbi:hypothetical protein Goshw_004500 [Gossypium schwendimanii]|uniref:Uncharacterized protein n=1 Tax=Gossypium schwendimanii TaxID=34291 RepID=A0A7J9MHL0_GOSSC|nr:hypothetical protein [Gossypium schwendimanii]